MNDAASTAIFERAANTDTAAIDKQHPWLGLASFTEEVRAYFHGREDEVGELARRVQRKLLTILFGQSGLGKTSILRAGLVPRLRPEGYCPIYVRVDYSPDAPSAAEQIKQAIFRETRALGEWTQTGVAVEGESLWEFLHHRDDALKDANGRTLVPLLIFDQFEEVFTIAQTDAAGRARASEFLTDLGDLVENRPPATVEARLDEDDSAIERFDFARADYRILIALREDYLAHLEGLKGDMPSITQNRMRLARMTGTQALAAVMKPGGRLVSQEVAEAIVRFTAGGAELRNAEVEPALLSLVCRELNNARITQGSAEISADVLAGSRDTILAEFYERSLADMPPRVRQVIEDHLLTDSGYRESLAEERFQKLLAGAGAPAGTMAKLVDRRLLRVEDRLDVRRVELTHDVLTGVVKASRDLRLEREARDEAERKLGAQRERELATRRALVRTRKIAVGCGVLAIAAILSALYGFIATRHAQRAEAEAVQTRHMAEQARGEAEKLVTYLLDDFQLELAPVGRLDVVGALAKRAIDYYDALPATLRSSETERNRALALVRYGIVLRNQSKLEQGRKAVDDAVGVLSRLRDQGDRSEMTSIGLALGLATQARLASSINDNDHAGVLAQRAVEAIEPLAGAPDASTSVRRAYGDVLTFKGFAQVRNNDETGLDTLDRARAAYRSIANLELTDPNAAAAYAEATAWKLDHYIRLHRYTDADRAGAEVLEVTARILADRPGHMQALRAQALATSPLARSLAAQGRMTEALAMADRTTTAWQEFIRLDPGNAISWSNLSISYLIAGGILSDMGQLSDAIKRWQMALALEKQTRPTLILWNLLQVNAGRIAAVQASMGNWAAAEDTLAITSRYIAWVADQYPPDSYERGSTQISADFWRTTAALSGAANERALSYARAFIASGEPLTPSGPAAATEKVRYTAVIYQAAAEALLGMGNDARAEQMIAKAQEMRRTMDHLPDEQVEREIVNGEVIHAIALARMGRGDEARKLMQPALDYHRPYASSESAQFRFEYAIALYAAAMSGVGDRIAELKTAGGIIDKLPPEFRSARYTAVWRARIDDAMRARRPA